MPFAFLVKDIDRITRLEVILPVPGEDTLVGGHIAHLQVGSKGSKEFFQLAHILEFRNCFFKLSLEVFHDLVNLIRIGLRNEVEVSLQGESPVSTRLDLLPNLIVGDVEFSEERAVRNVIEAVNGHPVSLDEALHHLHSLHITPVLVVKVDIVLPGFGKVFLRHLPDGVRLVDDVVFAHPLIPAVDGEVRPHHHTPDKPLLLIRHGIHLHLPGGIECLEVRHHRRIVHQGDLHHPRAVIGDNGIIDRDASDCDYHISVFPLYRNLP